MITVVKETGDVLFFNENEHVSFAFSKDEKKFWAYPTQPTAHIGLPRQTIEVVDVAEVIYTNEAQPTALTFKTDKAPTPAADYENDRLVDSLYKEMDRLEEVAKEEKRKMYPNYKYVQKSGHSVRFLNACKAADIETVGQLLALGRRGAEDIRNSGRKCVDLAAQALENLYGIKNW